MKRRCPNLRGFTLLELLIATLTVAMLASSLYASLYIAFKARQTALSSVETVRKCNLSMDLIQADLQGAVVPGGPLTGSFVGTSGQGIQGSGTDGLTFCTAAADIEPAESIGDIKKIQYACEPAADSGQSSLVRHVTTNLLAPTVTELKQEVICRGLKTLTLRYYDGSTWQISWDSTANGNLLPNAVEVTIELSDAPAGAAAMSRVFVIPCAKDSSTTAPSGETQ